MAALSSEVEKVCIVRYLHARELVRIPMDGCLSDDMDVMLIGARLVSVCVACVVRFPVLSHLRVTDTSCRSLAEAAQGKTD